MVTINYLYKTELSASKYNLNWMQNSNSIPSTITIDDEEGETYYSAFSYHPITSEEITITVKLIDFKNNPVSNKRVVVNCKNGYFNNNSSKKSISLTTNSSGIATTSYQTSVFGLDVITANDSVILINANDSGWQTADMDSPFEHYTNQQVQYRRYNNIVNIRGAATALGGIAFGEDAGEVDWIVFGLPPQLRPLNAIRRLQQGSSAYKFNSTVTAQGSVSVDRYNNCTGNLRQDIPNGAWLNMDIMYTVTD